MAPSAIGTLKPVEVSSTTTAASSHSQCTVAVIGAGYVGLQLAFAFGSEYKVIAYDISVSRVKELSTTFKPYPKITATADPKQLCAATHFLIAVPTLVLPDKNIDTSALESAISTISRYARAGTTVVVESSVSVGMTRRLLEPLIRSHDLKAGMSPEVCIIIFQS